MKLFSAVLLFFSVSSRYMHPRKNAKGKVVIPTTPISTKVFAPYTGTWIYEWDGKNLLAEMNSLKLDIVVASFAVAQTNGEWAECYANQTIDRSFKLTWSGEKDSPKFDAQVKEVQDAGKEVIIAFGGYSDPVLFPKGREIAGLITNVDRLAKSYIDFIKAHHVKRIDFDVEIGGSLGDAAVSRRRNDAILQIIKALPDIKVSYTLPVESKGLTTESLAILTDAASKKIPLTSVNLMTMNFGGKPDNNSPTMLNVGELTINAIKATKEQFNKANIPYNIGVIPMIGQNDFKNQIFTLEDAKIVKSFVLANDYVTYLGYWAMERDAPGVRPSGIGKGGCDVGFGSSTNSGTSAPAAAYVNALRL